MKKIISMAAMALVLASCGSDDSPTPDNSIEHPISLASVSLGSVTDFTRAGDQTETITSGSLGFFITKNGDKEESGKYICRNAKFECENKTWSCKDTYYWASDNAEIEYIAYYPYQELESYSLNIEWDVTDQINKDLCYKKTTTTNSSDNHSIAIELDHVCSKLVVNITKFGDEIKGENPNANSIKISGMSVKESFDLDNNSWTKNKETGEIDMSNKDGKSFEAILIPQTAAITLTVTVNEEEYIMNLPSQEFAKGTQYTLNIQVGQDITKAGAITRTPWIPADGGTITVE